MGRRGERRGARGRLEVSYGRLCLSIPEYIVHLSLSPSPVVTFLSIHDQQARVIRRRETSACGLIVDQLPVAGRM